MPIMKLPPFQNVGANLTAVLPAIPQGWTFEKIWFRLAGTTFAKDKITGLRLWLGGKKIWEVTGSHLNAINSYFKDTSTGAVNVDGTDAAPQQITMHFANPRALSLADRMIGAIDTSIGYSNFSLEMDIGAAVAPKLEAWAKISAPIPKASGFQDSFRTLIKSALPIPAATEASVPIPLGSQQGAFIRALHFFHTSITQLQITKDNFYLIDRGLNGVLQYDQNEFSRTTQAGLVSADFVLEDMDALAVPTLRAPGKTASFEVKVTTSAADNGIVGYSDLLQTHQTF